MELTIDKHGKLVITMSAEQLEEMKRMIKDNRAKMTEKEYEISRVKSEQIEKMFESIGKKTGSTFIPFEEQVPDENGTVVTMIIDPQMLNSNYENLSQEERDFLAFPYGKIKNMASKIEDKNEVKHKNSHTFFYIVSICWTAFFTWALGNEILRSDFEWALFLSIIIFPIMILGTISWRKEIFRNWKHSRLFRLFCFYTVCWAIAVIGYALIFDNDYFWSRYYNIGTAIYIARFYIVIFMPAMVAGALTYIYQRYVK